MIAGELRWTADGDAPLGVKRYVFLLDPVAGLLDIDRHPITSEGWARMESPAAGTSAELAAPSWATLEELASAIETLRQRGRFQSIVVRIQSP